MPFARVSLFIKPTLTYQKLNLISKKLYQIKHKAKSNPKIISFEEIRQTSIVCGQFSKFSPQTNRQDEKKMFFEFLKTRKRAQEKICSR